MSFSSLATLSSNNPEKVDEMRTNEISDIIDIRNVPDRELLFKGFEIGVEEDPVAVIIDGPSLYYYRKELEMNIDFYALNRILYANFPCIRHKVYLTYETVSSADGHSYMRPLLDFLSYNRYTVRSKQIDKDNSNKFRNMSMDVEIVTEMFLAAKWAKHIIFFGSSSEFIMPLTKIKEMGISITVVASENAGSRSVENDMRKIDNFVDLADPFFRRYLNNLKRDQLRNKNYIPGVGEHEGGYIEEKQQISDLS